MGQGVSRPSHRLYLPCTPPYKGGESWTQIVSELLNIYNSEQGEESLRRRAGSIFNIMKALVTGVTGFVGSAVARALVRAGTEVRGLVRPGADRQALDGLAIETVPGDLCDAASLRSALHGCRQVYHVAAHYALWARDPSVFYRVNVEGTRALLAAARESDVDRVVYTSTIGAIGLPEGGGPGTEETPVSLAQMAGDYKRSKYLAEQEVLQAAQAGLPVVIVNPSAPVGVWDVKPTPTGQIVVDFMKGRMVAYVETGMNLIDVDDVAVGHVRAMERGRVGERYILGCRNLMLKEVFEILSTLTGVRMPRLKLPGVGPAPGPRQQVACGLRDASNPAHPARRRPHGQVRDALRLLQSRSRPGVTPNPAGSSPGKSGQMVSGSPVCVMAMRPVRLLPPFSLLSSSTA